MDDQITITKFEPKKQQGLIVIITGNGKGKTTSAMGMALRGCGHGLKTTIVQFMKGDLYSGEWDGVKKLEPLVKLYHTGKGFCGIEGNPFPHSEHRKNAQEAYIKRRSREILWIGGHILPQQMPLCDIR